MEHVLLILLGVVGFVVHYLKQWAMGNTESTFWTYLFTNDVKHTVAAVSTFMVAIAGFMATGPELAATACYTAFLTGYAADTVNRG